MRRCRDPEGRPAVASRRRAARDCEADGVDRPRRRYGLGWLGAAIARSRAANAVCRVETRRYKQSDSLATRRDDPPVTIRSLEPQRDPASISHAARAAAACRDDHSRRESSRGRCGSSTSFAAARRVRVRRAAPRWGHRRRGYLNVPAERTSSGARADARGPVRCAAPRMQRVRAPPYRPVRFSASTRTSGAKSYGID